MYTIIITLIYMYIYYSSFSIKNNYYRSIPNNMYFLCINQRIVKFRLSNIFCNVIILYNIFIY